MLGPTKGQNAVSWLTGISLALLHTLQAQLPGALAGPATTGRTCASSDVDIKLPEGFCASVFADGLGRARHMAVASDGTVYVNTLGGGNKRNSLGMLFALRDSKGGGKADMIVAFGEAKGGTGIGLYKNWLFAETGPLIVRYRLEDGEIAPKGVPETVVSGLPLSGDHPMHPFAIGADGSLYVDVASATNSCQRENRVDKSRGLKPCDELKTRGGIWRYDANRIDQVFSEKERFATGLRNSEGIDFDSAGRIYATQHGRDQLYENWPNLYTSERGSELPAEELVLLIEGGDYGWPYCYFDQDQERLVLAPEYGGDGGEAIGSCSKRLSPVAAFPGHWAPNDLKIYKASQFPELYRGGAFIAFHGSWNRSSGPQQGYNVVFQPLVDGKASGQFSVFGDGFAGKMLETGRAEHRPTGLAIGPDGSLYVSDDVGGRIWRIVFRG